MTGRVCRDCGKLTDGTSNRCPKCKQARPRGPRGKQPQPNYQERKRRKQAVEDHVRTFGYVCPGFEVPPHPSYDLTAHHLVPQIEGGGPGPLGVFCRTCNGRKGAR